MKILALDLSTSTGYAVLGDNPNSDIPILIEKGHFSSPVEDFNVNKFPDKSPKYPHNMLKSALLIGNMVEELVTRHKPDLIVIENTVRGKNRHTQRILEWVHYAVLTNIIYFYPITYMDPSEWRKILGVYLSNEDKKHNGLVSKKKVRGKITRKHLSVRLINDTMGLELKLKDNDIADAIALGLAAWKKNNKT